MSANTANSAPTAKAIPGYIYFARGQKSGLVKIGFSQFPSQRARQVRFEFGEEVRLALVVPGNGYIEKEFHHVFRGYRNREKARGKEWFYERGRLAAFIASHADSTERRNINLRNEIVRRICTHPKLSWDDRQAILCGSPFSASTLRRLYGEK